MEQHGSRMVQRVQKRLIENLGKTTDNLAWLQREMPPYFFITMQKEVDAVSVLAGGLQTLQQNRRLILAEDDTKLILACLARQASLYETFRTLDEREISYVHIAHSYTHLPGTDRRLEIQRFEFDRKSEEEIASAPRVAVPQRIRREVAASLREHYPAYELDRLDDDLRILWLNNEGYVRISPAKRVAQILWLYRQGNLHGGVYLGVEDTEGDDQQRESRLLFAVANPPQKDFLKQTLEVLHRLGLRVRRAYCLTISNGVHPYFLATFYVRTREDELLDPASPLFRSLQQELYHTQILGTESEVYRELVQERVISGEDASLLNAMIAFCHTNLAHNNQPRYDLEGVTRAFLSHPDIALQLVSLFRLRFDPALEGRTERYLQAYEEVAAVVASYNSGRRTLDEFRRTIFSCALLFIRYTLKSNFFVLEKQALAFRLDPAYLGELDAAFTSGLPPERPFRVTFFFGRHGCGYHVGFSDIARGGWRTILTRTRDEYVTSANSLFREVYVLAHTQHLKNKDIYEGGSKMAAVLRAGKGDDQERLTRRLYKMQFGFINAFLDIFVTEGGSPVNPNVVDYYGEDEAIELGPDENMHDQMVELIARQSVKRGYLLGSGVISSKQVGINHKEYGVTSIGVVKFAEITMASQGIDIHRDPFSVKMTGGPNGDVAGNALRLLLERSPGVAVRLIVDGTGALYDPEGADHAALRRIVLRGDIDQFDPEALHPGGFLLLRTRVREEGLRRLFLRIRREEQGLVEEWISQDECNRQHGSLHFSTVADLFIPAGGRPETIDESNWQRFLLPDGTPSSGVIVEGANSFITPAARDHLQRAGVVIMRDASANKCGVISSSYEIIGNLLLTEREFLLCKEEYVADVISILEKRAEEEARLILLRHRNAGGQYLFTEISGGISREINEHYARLFAYFQQNPSLCNQPIYRRAIMEHLPRMIREHVRYRGRIKHLPQKYLFAIAASEIASSLVYRGDREADFVGMLRGHLQRNFQAA